MIIRTPGIYERETFTFCDTSKTRVKLRGSIRLKRRLSVFGAENAMNEITRVGVAHTRFVPPGSKCRPAFPTLAKALTNFAPQAHVFPGDWCHVPDSLRLRAL